METSRFRADNSSVRPPVGVVFLARHSVRASNVSMASHGSTFHEGELSWIRSFVVYAMGTHSSWKLMEKERLNLYFNSGKELGRLACFPRDFFGSSGRQSGIEC